MPPCLQKFDGRFRQCMQDKHLDAEHFFKVLSNKTIDGMTTKELRKQMCDQDINPKIVQCAMSSLRETDDCSKQEERMVQGTVKQALSQYESICK